MVSAVQPTRPPRDATDEEQPRRPLPGPEVLEQAALGTRVESLHRASAQTGTGRALAAYAEVADDTDRNELRRLLGFDAYA